MVAPSDHLLLRMKLEQLRKETVEHEVKPWKRAKAAKAMRAFERRVNAAYWEAAYEDYRMGRDW